MVWLIVVAALVVLGLAAWAGTGRFGAMPEPVTDAPRPVIPPGPVNRAFLDDLELPTTRYGYDTRQVDDYLHAHAAGEASGSPERTLFGVVRNGYSMTAVDQVMDRVASEWSAPGFERDEPAAKTDVLENGEDSDQVVEIDETDASEPPRSAPS